MKKIIPFLLFILLLIGCNESEKRIKILPYEVLHDNSSKVWILQSQLMDGEDITPEKRSDRITMTLFEDQTFMVHLISEFAYYSENNGDFYLNEEGDEITFQWSEQVKNTYEIVEVSKNKLEYKSKPSDDVEQHLTFIPITKPSPEEVEGAQGDDEPVIHIEG